MNEKNHLQTLIKNLLKMVKSFHQHCYSISINYYIKSFVITLISSLFKNNSLSYTIHFKFIIYKLLYYLTNIYSSLKFLHISHPFNWSLTQIITSHNLIEFRNISAFI